MRFKEEKSEAIFVSGTGAIREPVIHIRNYRIQSIMLLRIEKCYRTAPNGALQSRMGCTSFWIVAGRTGRR